jgi:hypothetical protein
LGGGHIYNIAFKIITDRFLWVLMWGRPEVILVFRNQLFFSVRKGELMKTAEVVLNLLVTILSLIRKQRQINKKKNKSKCGVLLFSSTSDSTEMRKQEVIFYNRDLDLSLLLGHFCDSPQLPSQFLFHSHPPILDFFFANGNKIGYAF